MIEPLATKAVPALMVGGGLALAFAQGVTESVPTEWTGLVAALIQALTVGGGLAAAGAFLLKRGGKFLDDRAAADAAERAAERAERERQYTDHKDTTTRYIVSLEQRVQRTEERYDQLVAHLMGAGKPVNHETGPIA